MARIGRAFPARPIVKAPYPWAPNIQLSKTYNCGDIPAASSLSDTAYWYGNNREFSFDVCMLGPGVTVTSMTYGGANCTLVGVRSTVTSFGRVESWRILQSDSGAPPAGGNEIAVELSGSIEFTVVGVARTGVHQTTPTESFNSNQATNGGGASDATVDVTSVTDNCVIHAAVVASDTSISANQTSRNNVAGTLGSGANEDTGPVTPAGVTTMSYTGVGALVTWAIAGYAIRPVSAVGSSSSMTFVKGDLTLSSVAGKMTTAFGGVKGNLTLSTVAGQMTGVFGGVKGDLVLSGNAGTMFQGQYFTFAKGDLTLSSVAGKLTDSFGGVKGDLTLSGQVASFSQGQQFVFVKGDLTLSSAAVKMTDSFAGVKGDLVLSSVAGGMANAITGVKGDLTLSSVAGKMSSAFGGVKGDLLLTGYAGSEWNVYTAVKGDLVLTGYASSMVSGTVFTAVKGNLTLTGYAAPVAEALRIVKGDLVLSGYAQSFTNASGFALIKGDLLLTGYTLSMAQMPTMIVAGNLVLTGYALRVSRTMQGWHLYGDAPSIVSLHGDSL